MIEALRKMRSQKGFTLLELLVVVAIIAILATLILANLNRARKQAQDAKVQSEVKAISDAVQLYQTSNFDDPTKLTLISTSGATVAAKDSPTPAALAPLKSSPDPLLKVIPTHPLTTASPAVNYKYKSDTTTGFTYTVAGDLISKTGCYMITDGVVDTAAASSACPTNLP